MKKILISILVALTLSAKADSIDGIYAKAQRNLDSIFIKTEGDIEALRLWDDCKDGIPWEEAIKNSMERIRTMAVSNGAETEDEVNAYVNAVVKVINHKFDLYRSLSN